MGAGVYHPRVGEAKVMRVDRWVWTARWFKTRALATQAVAGGKVRLNGRRVKPAADLRAGDELEIVRGPYTHVVVVRGLAERRRSAAEAALLYEETEESRKARDVRRIQMRDVPVPSYEGKGRPTKRERRKLERARRRPPD
jgi:ribosome-associated heat shock protein Hsp15